MDAQSFNFAPELFPKWGFSAQNVVLLDKNFFDRLKIRDGRGCPAPLFFRVEAEVQK